MTKPLRPGAYIDEDASDAALDGPQPVYGPDHHEMTWADIEKRLQSGEALPKIPASRASADPA